MFLTISTTHSPATDLGFLLHKHPEKHQTFSTAYGDAHVFYPEASEQRCTVALLLDVDPVALVRGKGGKGNKGRKQGHSQGTLAQYVNDRPYAAGSLLAVALGATFRTALRGRCELKPELAQQAIPLEIHIPALAAGGGVDVVKRMFEPLGWTVEAQNIALDDRFPEWGDSRYVTLTLTGTLKLSDALNHLYVLLPVLDGGKHYWVAPDEVDKLVRAGEGWLSGHPEKALIARRYLARSFTMTRQALEQLEQVALERLADSDDTAVENIDNAVPEETNEEEAAKPTPLAQQRREAIVDALKQAGANRVLDLGCGEGALVRELLKDPLFTEITGVDVSARALQIASRRLKLDRMNERQRDRVKLLQGALTYTDPRFKNSDAAVLSEVIEHLDEPRLPALAYTVFGSAKPQTVIVSTPNVEYNVKWETLPAGHVRHSDHRFEWTRAEFAAWAQETATKYGYTVTYTPVGDNDPEVGPPTQMATFSKTNTDEAAA